MDGSAALAGGGNSVLISATAMAKVFEQNFACIVVVLAGLRYEESALSLACRASAESGRRADASPGDLRFRLTQTHATSAAGTPDGFPERIRSFDKKCQNW